MSCDRINRPQKPVISKFEKYWMNSNFNKELAFQCWPFLFPPNRFFQILMVICGSIVESAENHIVIIQRPRSLLSDQNDIIQEDTLIIYLLFIRRYFKTNHFFFDKSIIFEFWSDWAQWISPTSCKSCMPFFIKSNKSTILKCESR